MTQRNLWYFSLNILFRYLFKNKHDKKVFFQSANEK